MIIIKGIDGITLDDNGIFERGQRAERKVVDDWSGLTASESLRSVLSKINTYELKERNKPKEYKSISEVIGRIDCIVENNKEYNSEDTENKGFMSVGGLQHNSELKVLFNILGISEYYKYSEGRRLTCFIMSEYLKVKNKFIGNISEINTSTKDYNIMIANAFKGIKQNLEEQEERQSKMDKLEELCKPISDYLRENYCPHDSIVITDDKIRLVRDEIGIPVDRDCKKEDEEFCLYDKWLLRK